MSVMKVLEQSMGARKANWGHGESLMFLGSGDFHGDINTHSTELNMPDGSFFVPKFSSTSCFVFNLIPAMGQHLKTGS